LIAASAAIALLAACSSATPAPTIAPTVPAQPTEAEIPTAQATDAAVATTEAPATQPTEAVAPTAAPIVALPAKVNLNTATADEILAIPNTGNRMVREFEEYRPYTSILQFRREIGKYVDDAQVAEYEKYVYVPISPNNADAATLQQLPGVDATIAEQLIAARPFAAKADFIAKLGELISPDQANAVSAWVEEQ
jgi:DNA uptake protein ComE-like DNA-binding protein